MTRTSEENYTVKADIPLPHWLLACQGLSYGAKVACALVIHYTRGSAGAVITPSELADKMGDEEESVRAYLNELDRLGLIFKSADGSCDSNRLNCFFGTQTKKQSREGNAPTRKEPLSVYDFEICLKFARRIEENGGRVRNLNALAGHFYWTGTQDREIAAMLQEIAADDPQQDKSSNVLSYRKLT